MGSRFKMGIYFTKENIQIINKNMKRCHFISNQRNVN